MAKERLKSPRARLFVALDLPDDVREGIVAWQQHELRDQALRVLRPEALHFTLAFLGYHPEREIDAIGEAATREAGGAPSIEFRPDPVGVPRRGKPRLFALEAESEGAISLQAELSDRLQEAGFYEPEKRPYWPHLTVARVRREKRGSKRSASVERLPGRLPERLLRPFACVRLTLYRSHLRPQGAEYESVAEVELPTKGRNEVKRDG
jgi:RNA 2',3'-cyclic 3'-phosphodiesterase